MKNTILLLSLTLFCGTTWAQNNKGSNNDGSSDNFREEIVIPLSQPGKAGTLEVNQIYGGIKVTGYDGEEVVVIATQKRLKQAAQMKNGLRKIENSSLALEAEESDNYVEVQAMNHASSNKGAMHLEIKVPRNFDLKLSNINDGQTEVENISGDLEISNINNDITLNQVSGAAVIDSVNGDIKATFTSTKDGNKIIMTTFNGDVDIALPKNSKAGLKMKTFSGEIFTDFDVNFETTKPEVQKESNKHSYKVKIEKWVTGKINGGGAEFTLKSHQGDLIVRSN